MNQKKILAILLSLSMVLSMVTVSVADSNGQYVYGTPQVYDIYDLTGSGVNTVLGTNDTWDGQIKADISAEHKENMAFRCQLTIGKQQVRLSLNAKDGANIYDPPGYSVYLYGDTGRVEIRKNNSSLINLEVDGVAGTYVFEAGIVDVLSGTDRVGKHIYVKMDDTIVCEYDDMSGFLTGDALGTKIIDFHYGAAIQMNTVYTMEYGTPEVYDIYDLTGNEANTILGTDSTWDGQIKADISAEHKENMAFRCRLTMGKQQVRLSLNAKDGANIYDPPGYSVYLYGDTGRVEIRKNNSSLVNVEAAGVAGTYVFEAGIVDMFFGGKKAGKHIYVMMDDTVVCEYDDTTDFLTGDALGTKVIDFHYGAAIQMDSVSHTEPELPDPETLTKAEPVVYGLSDLTGETFLIVAGQQQGSWGTTLGYVEETGKTSVAFASEAVIDEPQTIMLGLGLADTSMAVQNNSGYVLEIVNRTGEPDTVKIHRAGTQLCCEDQTADFDGTHTIEYGMLDMTLEEAVVGKRLYLKLDGEEVLHYDDLKGFLTEEQTGTKVELYASGSDLQLGRERNLSAGEPAVYDLYDLQGVERLTVTGRETDPDKWGTTLGYMAGKHKENMAFKTSVTMDEAQSVMLGIGLGELSSASQNNSGYVLEIVTQTQDGAPDTVKLFRAGTQLYAQDQTVDFNGEYELEFGAVELYDTDADNAVAGKRIYVKKDGIEILHFDDTAALSGSSLGTKVDVYASGKKLQMASLRGYQAAKAAVYDLYDLAHSETVEVSHTDDAGEVLWGVLIGSVNDSDKGNVAIRTKVTMSREQKQNLLIGLGLTGHWPVSGGLGYQIELISDPASDKDSVRIYKRSKESGSQTVNCYSSEVDFDFNGCFELETGVTDLTDNAKKVVARRIYIRINGEELIHFDDTAGMIPAADMGSVMAAYVSNGTATLGSCLDRIPSAKVKTYDIYDLSGRASVHLNRTDAGGTVIWSNELGEISESDRGNFVLRTVVDTSKVDRSAMQELILGLCKETELFDGKGYRLSLYFGTNGGTSLVLRSGESDQVLASANVTLPSKYEMEVGVSDCFNSSYKRIGKKIYFKADGKELLSYLDTNTGRSGGGLLCAYTTSPVILTTKYNHTTIPVTLVVNGEETKENKYLIYNTDAVIGRKSIIDIAISNRDQAVSVLMKRVLLGNRPIDFVSDKQGVYVFELESPSAADRLTVEIEVHNLRTDEPRVFDLYELTGKKEIVIPASGVDQIATLFADGREGVLNRAVRFAYYIPGTGGGLRLGYGSDTSDIWSRVGMHIEIWTGFATISSGFHVSALSTGSAEIFRPDSWSIVEVGIVKCYEDGVYKYDRWYVKAGATADDLKLITYYDSTQRYNSSLNIMARTPDTGDDFIVASTLDVKEVTDVSPEEERAAATAVYKPLFLKGESVKLVVIPDEGKTLKTMYVNGQEVAAALTPEGSYVYTVESAEDNVEFGYTLAEDTHTYHITADEAEHLEIMPESTSVTAGGSVIVKIKVEGGYTLSSLLVNDTDYLPMASYDRKTLTYTLTISGIREDKHIRAEAAELSEEGPVADATEVAEEHKDNNAVIITVAAAAVAVLAAATVVLTIRAKKKRAQGNEKTGSN